MSKSNNDQKRPIFLSILLIVLILENIASLGFILFSLIGHSPVEGFFSILISNPLIPLLVILSFICVWKIYSWKKWAYEIYILGVFGQSHWIFWIVYIILTVLLFIAIRPVKDNFY
jgi:hypothetical protein